MTFAKIRLGVVALLFLGWLSYLGYLAYNYAHPVIVSRSQFIAAEFPVVAQIQLDDKGQPKAEIELLEDLRVGERKRELPKTFSVDNLPDLKYPDKKNPQAGPHLLLLILDGKSFKVTGTPPAPGSKIEQAVIYPWTPEVERQIKHWQGK